MKTKFLLKTMLLALVIMFGCGSSKKPHGKLKPGKPLPCPQKDC